MGLVVASIAQSAGVEDAVSSVDPLTTIDLRYLQTSIDPTVISSLEEAVKELSFATDTLWVLCCGVLIFFMQVGFASLEVGSVRINSVESILFKNVLDICVGGICWWATGFAIAYSLQETQHAFFGQGLLSWPTDSTTPSAGVFSLSEWFFQWGYSTTAATIVSGGIAERARIESYLIYSAVMTGVIYPVVVSWTWNPDGWLRTSFQSPYYDYAGSGVIHLTGGIGALVGSIVLGSRSGRFKEGVSQIVFEPHSLPLIVLGTIFLWFGWFGFNMGSTRALHTSTQALTASLIAVNVTLAAAAGGLSTFTLRYIMLKHHKYNVKALCNGILAGLVSITASCANVTPSGALIVGVVGGILYQIASWSIRLLKIDDPVDAFPIHGIGGIWGVLAVALVDFSEGFDAVSFAPNVGVGYQFGIQLLAVVVITAFVGVSSLLVFGLFRMVQFLRIDVPPTVERCRRPPAPAAAGRPTLKPNDLSAGVSVDSRAHDFDDLSST
ncbi:Ammonium transporter, putative [Perkinsus marinus ATCC 50983]|uniref:Ammonium transporter n=1 Tax=Perkinsus marinus (strain ATCC 50983 / TXsc) TaxID=423536 RepID=C5KTM7_PERM5|nr:Ammonium transporter, putative [Perkinsus marinus ATCC 50983]EER12206.1 Ammonium transporter, putative [Perkinsus marinus ATCC 50983]|eukprot:XP_002780411.1 Ammonium transporter, putative [Perkinsus marinus ATCC 50983]